MSLNPKAKALRIANLEQHHKTMQAALTTTGQSLAALAAAAGITVDLAEKQLSLLVDEGLCTRTTGSRTTATYKAA